ncbi:MAG: putative Ig domain-containing protein, partial [Planctomycetes bacterium]|nr:putative Ig domain-containing protein [Planctomycetota bacterium]
PEFSLSPQTVTMMEGDEFNPQGSTNIDISGSYSETSPASGSYTLIEVTGLPPGVSITQGAAFAQKKIGVILQGMPEPGASLGSPYTAVVTVSDGLAPALVAELELEIIVMDGFDILTPDLPAATEAVAYNPFQIEIGAGVAPYTFSDVAGLPVGMTLSEDGILSGTPAYGSASFESFSLSFTVTDSSQPEAISQSFSGTISLDVEGSGGWTGPFTLLTSSLPVGTEGVAYDVPLVSEGGHESQSWAAQGLPNGLLVAKVAGVWKIAGAPQAKTAGTYSVILSVTDHCEVSATIESDPIQLVVESINPSETALTLLTAMLPSTIEGETYSATYINAIGGTKPYEVTISGLPLGIELTSNPATGTFILTGKAIKGSDGVYQVTVQIADASLQPQIVSDVFTLFVASADVPLNETIAEQITPQLLAGGAAAAGCAIAEHGSRQSLIVSVVLLFGLCGALTLSRRAA